MDLLHFFSLLGFIFIYTTVVKLFHWRAGAHCITKQGYEQCFKWFLHQKYLSCVYVELLSSLFFLREVRW